jgi:hypothetical protein
MSIFDNKHSRDKKRVYTGRCLNESWEKRKGGGLLSFEGSLRKKRTRHRGREGEIGRRLAEVVFPCVCVASSCVAICWRPYLEAMHVTGFFPPSCHARCSRYLLLMQQLVRPAKPRMPWLGSCRMN